MPEGKKYLVQDYMRTDVTKVSPSDTIQEVTKMMIDNKTNGVVVMNNDGTVAGMLSSWDIIKFIVPDYLEDDRHLASFEAESMFGQQICRLADKPISECMTKKVYSIHPKRTLMEAIALLAEHHIRQLPVVDEHGLLIGYLNRTDIKLAIGEVICKRTKK